MSSSNNLRIGYGISAVGGNTNIYGNRVLIRYSNANTTGIFLEANGNVLIGTTEDKGQKLQVTGTVRASNWFYSDENTGWYSVKYAGGIYMKDSTYVTAYNGKSFMVERSNGDLDAFYTANRTDTGHKIGFGVGSGGVNRGIWDFTNSRWAFYIDGSGNYNVNGNLTATGSITFGSSASDMRLKDVTSRDYDAVSILRGLSTFKYRWNSTAKGLTDNFANDNDEHFGLSAQELQKVSNYLVSNFDYGSGNKYLVLRKEELVPLLVQAVKQLLDRIERLENNESKQ